ncbi:glucosyl-3-phosphoglycerate synthase [Phycicoccus sonneratiae]|uniref:Glucosyl-3-phosphoglycerate synthase n=1 Tax=Phycicoccus sonneratiae TaxID=2807628 RepID=A0ABS2CNT7_9MICO|nr:glucosyl-3-phosphoglycerate synthase [Phycicoccus sonneraticus]MBM6401549.1 glucosyl-3-phosphoglycerate synthase [Phycicoccus sonneraticus]
MPVRTVAGPVPAPEELLAAKGATRVSVVVPARDEESTVGEVVTGVRRAWVEEVPLVDELVVIDSDSTDRTAAVARAAGATVHAAAEVLPGLGSARGKGEALWKALHVTTGDVLVFLDADLIEWGTHFVSGLVAPLLADPGVALVKAVYDRPLLDAAGHEAETGGRVTELVARPLLALHRPDLAGLVQPLAGEWAVRRSAFERFSVPVGYGVEIAALVDTADLLGAEAIAQVDLGRRTHRHHRHDTLGPMAVQVLAAVEARLGRGAPSRAEGAVLTQYVRAAEGFVPRPRPVDLTERPPAVSVEGYAQRTEVRR